MAANAHSQGMGGGQQMYIPDVEVESFIWQVPAKWYPFSKESDVKIDAYLFPTGQEPTDFKQMLHFEEFRTTLGVTEAISVYQLKTQAASAACANTYEEKLEFNQMENGYSMVQWSDSCISSNGSGSYGVTKAIVGNEKLYVAKKAWKFEPSEAERRKWLGVLRTVYVCDPRTGVNRCMPPGGAGGGGGRR